MYNPSLQKQLIAARIDDIKRAQHRQHAAYAHPGSGSSRDSRRRPRIPGARPRLVRRFAH